MKRYQVYQNKIEFKKAIKDKGYWLEPLCISKYSMLLALFDDYNNLIQVARVIR